MQRAAMVALALEIAVVRGPTPVHAEAGHSSTKTVSVRVYNFAHAPEQMLQGAAREAAQIFESAGLPVRWPLCRIRLSVDQPDDPGCEGAVSVNEFALRIIAGSPRDGVDRAAPEILGYTLISPDRRGVVATVLAQRVSDLATQSGIDAIALLGRVMAHEVGHLLLGSSEHAGQGLMRAQWKLGLRVSAKTSDWRFTKEEAARMRRRISVVSTN